MACAWSQQSMPNLSNMHVNSNPISLPLNDQSQEGVSVQVRDQERAKVESELVYHAVYFPESTPFG